MLKDNPNRPSTEVERVLINIVDEASKHVRSLEKVLGNALAIITEVSIHTEQQKLKTLTATFLQKTNSVFRSWKPRSKPLGKKNKRRRNQSK